MADSPLVSELLLSPCCLKFVIHMREKHESAVIAFATLKMEEQPWGPLSHRFFGISRPSFVLNHPFLPDRGGKCQQWGCCGCLCSCGYKKFLCLSLCPLLWQPSCGLCRVTAICLLLIQASRVKMFPLQAFLHIPLSSGKSQRSHQPGTLGRREWSLFLTEAPVTPPAVHCECAPMAGGKAEAHCMMPDQICGQMHDLKPLDGETC